ncbi:hypothetical protein [Streptomyces sp. NPDC094032]|uniref:hypothetical protein n=1 Tax=Streptomyces sp. NPDC094032 TaxID=3155308 RepID=UPI003316E73F
MRAELPDEYERLPKDAKVDVPAEPCVECAYLGAAALELADLLGHDRQGHQVQRALWSYRIRSTAALLAALDGDLGLYYLRGQGLGTGGLERVHNRLRRLEWDWPVPGTRRPREAPEGADVDDDQEVVLKDLIRELVLDWRTRAAATTRSSRAASPGPACTPRSAWTSATPRGAASSAARRSSAARDQLPLLFQAKAGRYGQMWTATASWR